MLKKRLWPAIALAVLFAVSLSGLWKIYSWQQSLAAQEKAHPKPSYHSADNQNYLYRLWEWGTHDAITVYTLLLAIFTGALVRVSYLEIRYLNRADKTSRKLAKISKQQLKIQGYQTDIAVKQKEIARQQFIVTHRPHLVVRDVVKEDDTIIYLIINRGEVDATILESWIMVEHVPHLQALRPLRSPGHDDLGRLVLAAGEAQDITYKISGTDSVLLIYLDRDAQSAADADRPQYTQTYFTGTIVYEGPGGHRRRTVFRRRWNGVSGGFERIDNPAYEYED